MQRAFQVFKIIVSLAICETLVVALSVMQQATAQTAPGTSRGQAASQVSTGETADKRIQRGYGFYEPAPLDFDDHEGYVQIFNGSDLKNWDGDPAVWHVKDNCIVGEPPKALDSGSISFISFHGFEAEDFDLKLEIKVENGGGSGIQYRSKTGVPLINGDTAANRAPRWLMTGPQADFWFPVAPQMSEWTGQFYSENTPLRILAWRGQVVESARHSYPKLLGNIGNRDALGGYIKVNDWNQYLIMARGGTFIHVINGQLMVVYLDDDPDSSNNRSGLVGIEIEGFSPGSQMKVSVRNVWIKKLK